MGRGVGRGHRTQRRAIAAVGRARTGVGGGEGRRVRPRGACSAARAALGRRRHGAVRGAGAGGGAPARGRHRPARCWCSASSRPTRCAAAVQHGLQLTVYSLRSWRSSPRSAPCDHPVHLKIDTGMRRVGAPRPTRSGSPTPSPPRRRCGWRACSPTSPWPTSRTTRSPTGSSIGSTTCSPRSPPRVTAPAGARRQLGRCARAPTGALRTWCARASPSTASRPAPVWTHVRSLGLRPALSLHARVSHVKRVAAGDRISYGLRHTFERDTTVATLPIGYADGVPRRLHAVGGSVLIGGNAAAHRRCRHDGPVDGRLRRRPGAVGDHAVLIGDARATQQDHRRRVGRSARHHRLRDRVRHLAPCRTPRPTYADSL